MPNKEKSKSKGVTRGERKKMAQDAHSARSAGGASSGTPQTVKRGARERVQDAAVGLKKTGDGKGKTAKLEESKPSGKAAERRAGGRSSETGAKKSGKTGAKGEEKKKVPREKEICIICQEALNKTKTETKKLPCGHEFHRSCLVPWFREHDTCPCCRTTASSVCPRGELLMNTSGPAPPASQMDFDLGFDLFGEGGPFGPGGLQLQSIMQSVMTQLSTAGAGGAGSSPHFVGSPAMPMMMAPRLPGSAPAMVMLNVMNIADAPGVLMPVGSEDSMQAEINHDTVTREMDPQACDCEECQQGRRADSAGTRRDLRSEAMVVCELCQKESEPMSDVWFCDACKKNLCKSCGNVELCPLESCSKQLCSKCARKSKCKGCKRGQPLEGNTTRTGAATGGASSGGVTSSRTMNSRPEDLAMSLLGAARAASSEAAEAARVVQALEETMELEAEKKRLEERIAELEAEKKRQQEQLKDSLEEKKRQQEQLKDLRRKKDAQNGHEACESGADTSKKGKGKDPA